MPIAKSFPKPVLPKEIGCQEFFGPASGEPVA